MTVQSNLSFEQINAIPIGKGVPFQDSITTIAPHVTAWNVVRQNHDTGEPEAVPSAEFGPEVMRLLDHVEAPCLISQVKYGCLGTEDERQKRNPRPPLRPGQRTSAPRHKA